MGKVFFHIDMDAFFASVEQLDNPELRGRPVIVGGTGPRGVVSTCSYEARRYGVRSAMPSAEARKRCPAGIFIQGRMKRYKQVSSHIMKILDSFSPEVNKVSIDEAYLDMTGTSLIFGPPMEAGKKLKDAIREKAGLTVSVGIAANRMMAKLASEHKKPDGLFMIEPGKEIDFLDSIRLRDLWGVGKKTLEKLNDSGITEISELRKYSLKMLAGMFGEKAAEYLYNVSRGKDPGVWNNAPKSRSISSEITLENDTKDIYLLRKILLDISRQLMFRLIDNKWHSRTVSVKIKYHDFTSSTSQITLKRSVKCSDEIYETAKALLDENLDRSKPVRLVGATLMSIEEEAEGIQPDLFESSYSKKGEVEKAIRQLQVKRPGIKVFKATLIDKSAGH